MSWVLDHKEIEISLWLLARLSIRPIPSALCTCRELYERRSTHVEWQWCWDETCSWSAFSPTWMSLHKDTHSLECKVFSILLANLDLETHGHVIQPDDHQRLKFGLESMASNSVRKAIYRLVGLLWHLTSFSNRLQWWMRTSLLASIMRR